MRVTPLQAAGLAHYAGLRGDARVIAVAVGIGESGLNAAAQGDTTIQTAVWGPSVGIWQIRSLKADRGTGRTRDADRLTNPFFNALSMASISGTGTNWRPWTIYTNGSYRNHLAVARDAVAQLERLLPAGAAVGIPQSQLADLVGLTGTSSLDVEDPSRLTQAALAPARAAVATVELIRNLTNPTILLRAFAVLLGVVGLVVAVVLIAQESKTVQQGVTAVATRGASLAAPKS